MLSPELEVTKISNAIEGWTKRPLPAQSIDLREAVSLEDHDFSVAVTFDRFCLARGCDPLRSLNTPREKRGFRVDRRLWGSGEVSVSDKSSSDRA
jgi:hypothetical protein